MKWSVDGSATGRLIFQEFALKNARTIGFGFAGRECSVQFFDLFASRARW
jgi:hypothetical protein